MSAGVFERSRYEADNGDVHAIRVQPETIAATFGGTANNPPAGAVDQQVSARVGGGNRRYGVKARAVSVTWTGAPPAGYADDELLRVPILTPDLYDAITPNSTVGTYLGANVIVVGKLPERVR